MYRNILVPLDDSELAANLVTQALDFARALGARLTFFHARADYAATSDGALQLAMAPEQFAEQAAGAAPGILAKAEAAARAAKVEWEAVAVTSDRPFEAILETAEARGCDLIFMASHGRRGLRGLFLGSQTQKVLEHARLPVLVASVESNVEGRDMQAATATIKDEHRSLAAVIHAMRHLVQKSRESDEAPDLELLSACLFYIRNFPAVLHHPKEEQWLFSRLRGADAELDALIATLEGQHREGAARLDALGEELEALNAGRIDATAFGQALERFAEGEWEHMSMEEKLILPAAQERLTEADWREIAAHFAANRDPRFGAEPDEAYRKLFSRIVRLAQQRP
jgi:nucleotide-binding universal stress UspA family protein/hemerythrin-like domain-containing protein